MSTYIVIADVARARVVARNGKGTALEVADFVHPESEARTIDLRTGIAAAAVGAGFCGSRQGDNRAATIESRAAFFAKELAGYLQDVRVNCQADELVLVAAPPLLGVLREKLDAKTRELVTRTVAEDFSTVPYADLQERSESL